MLVLSRKIGESIRIADDIEVMVVEVKQGKVRLGFRCPDDIPIMRQEIYDRVRSEEETTLTLPLELAEV